MDRHRRADDEDDTNQNAEAGPSAVVNDNDSGDAMDVDGWGPSTGRSPRKVRVVHCYLSQTLIAIIASAFK